MLMSWCTDNRIQIDSRLQIIDSPHYEADSIASDEPSRERGLSVYSREELIECDHTRESPSNHPSASRSRKSFVFPSFDAPFGTRRSVSECYWRCQSLARFFRLWGH